MTQHWYWSWGLSALYRPEWCHVLFCLHSDIKFGPNQGDILISPRYRPVVRAKLDIALWSGLYVMHNPVVPFDLWCQSGICVNIALGLCLETNIALSYASCYIDLLTTLLMLYFTHSTHYNALTNNYFWWFLLIHPKISTQNQLNIYFLTVMQ